MVIIDIIEIHKLVGYTHLHSPKSLGILQANNIPNLNILVNLQGYL
ncbi:MAG: hypothetical protein IJ965_05435 [Campylobacter sp.]|nr:hypothetical protein [Campylobacter sp.]